mmetsp:Transcript_20733/g.30808  ORF Transcript_20733/g.30808 Transcript_20733/m.30808 type:complete len:86 (-) Transcript_20733:201-458(-)
MIFSITCARQRRLNLPLTKIFLKLMIDRQSCQLYFLFIFPYRIENLPSEIPISTLELLASQRGMLKITKQTACHLSEGEIGCIIA